MVVDDGCGMFLEVVGHALIHVLELNGYIAVSVWSCLLMVESNSMSKLMDNNSFLWIKKNTAI